MKLNKAFGIPAVLCSVLFWGISFVSTKIVLQDISPITIALLRQVIALIPLFALMIIKKESFKLKKGELIRFTFAALFGIVLYFVFENQGLTLTSASNASMLVAAIPIFILIIESITNKKKMDFASFFCIVASLFGVYFVVFEGGIPDFGSNSFLGNLLVFGAMVSWIIFTFISKKLSQSYSSIKLTTIQTIISIPLFMPFVMGELGNWKLPSGKSLLNLIFLGVFCSAIAYVLFLFGLKNLGPVLPSALLNLIPVVTIIVGSVVLLEKISSFQIIGTILIILSLTFLSIIKTKSNR